MRQAIHRCANLSGDWCTLTESILKLILAPAHQGVSAPAEIAYRLALREGGQFEPLLKRIEQQQLQTLAGAPVALAGVSFPCHPSSSNRPRAG